MLSPSEWTFKHEDCTLNYEAERKYQKYILKKHSKGKVKTGHFQSGSGTFSSRWKEDEPKSIKFIHNKLNCIIA